MSEIKVNSIKGVGASTAAITVNNSDGTCTANITNNLSNRRLTINGDMKIAQRGTSSTSNGFHTVDRFQVNFDSGLTESPTQAQVALSSSDTPYSSGFRYALKITNGNQTSQDANDYLQIAHKIEAQDIAQSGWNYTSSSSNITLSFWVKASIAQTMYARLNAEDASRAFSFAFSATTSWTKITKTIAGDSNLVFNNDNGVGIALYIIPFYGTSYTTSGHTNDAWIADSGTDQVTDMANTWFSGNDATLEITGVQLEVSDHATDFEHRPIGVEKRLCMRYYQEYKNIQMAGYIPDNNARAYGLGFNFPVEFRSAPTLTISNTGSSSGQMVQDGETGGKITTLVSTGMTSYNAEINVNLHADMTNYRPAVASSAGWTANETKYMFNGEL